MSNHSALNVEWDTSQNTCGLKMFLSEEDKDDKHQLVSRHPNIIEIMEEANTIESSLASKLIRNMRMLAKTIEKKTTACEK